jgi:hypothetical protein
MAPARVTEAIGPLALASYEAEGNDGNGTRSLFGDLPAAVAFRTSQAPERQVRLDGKPNLPPAGGAVHRQAARAVAGVAGAGPELAGRPGHTGSRVDYAQARPGTGINGCQTL